MGEEIKQQIQSIREVALTLKFCPLNQLVNSRKYLKPNYK